MKRIRTQYLVVRGGYWGNFIKWMKVGHVDSDFWLFPLRGSSLSSMDRLSVRFTKRKR